MRARIVSLAVVIAAAASSPAIADSQSFQQGVLPTNGYAGSQATYIDSGNVSTQFNSAAFVQVGNSGVLSLDTRGLFSFDLSAIPAGASVTGASLRLTGENNDATSQALPSVLILHQLSAAFIENEATWQQRIQFTNWSTAGGDFSATVLSNAVFDPTAMAGVQGTFASTANFIAATQGVVDGSDQLYLLVKLGNESGTTRNIFQFYTDESGANATEFANFRPLLTVTYEVPEPAFASFMAIGILLVGRRSR